MPMQPINRTNFGALAMSGAKLTLKMALNAVLNNRQLVDHIASRLHEDEADGVAWASLKAPQKAIWIQRVQSVVLALGESVGT